MLQYTDKMYLRVQRECHNTVSMGIVLSYLEHADCHTIAHVCSTQILLLASVTTLIPGRDLSKQGSGRGPPLEGAQGRNKIGLDLQPGVL